MEHDEDVVADDAPTFARRALLGGAAAVAGTALAAAQGKVARALPPSIVGPLNTYLISPPIRVYNTRLGGEIGAPDDENNAHNDTPMVRGEVRTIDVTKVFSVGDSTGVDSGSSGVLLNVTCVAVSGQGYLRIWADQGVEPQTSSVNWDRVPATVANNVICRHNAGFISVKCDGLPSGCSTHVIIDVLGYFDDTGA